MYFNIFKSVFNSFTICSVNQVSTQSLSFNIVDLRGSSAVFKLWGLDNGITTKIFGQIIDL